MRMGERRGDEAGIGWGELGKGETSKIDSSGLKEGVVRRVGNKSLKKKWVSALIIKWGEFNQCILGKGETFLGKGIFQSQ